MNEKICLRILYTSAIIIIILICYCTVSMAHKETYDRKTNNCTHMSKQLEDIIETIGIPVTLMRGHNGTKGHMWIKIGIVELDSVTLFPVFNSKYNQQIHEYKDFDDYEKNK